jgi:hypothetical protein
LGNRVSHTLHPAKRRYIVSVKWPAAISKTSVPTVVDAPSSGTRRDEYYPDPLFHSLVVTLNAFNGGCTGYDLASSATADETVADDRSTGGATYRPTGG